MVAGHLSLQKQLNLMAKKFQATSSVASRFDQIYVVTSGHYSTQQTCGSNSSAKIKWHSTNHELFKIQYHNLIHWDVHCSSLWQAVQVATQNDMRKHTCHGVPHEMYGHMATWTRFSTDVTSRLVLLSQLLHLSPRQVKVPEETPMKLSRLSQHAHDLKEANMPGVQNQMF